MWRRKIKEYLSREVDHCSLTADCWTGSGDKKFLGVTLHCLTCDMGPITIVLGMIPIQASQSGMELARLLEELINLYDIKEKLLTISTDQGSNM
ncbi:hypothetical protein BG003_002988, partial [Podila horticola]